MIEKAYTLDITSQFPEDVKEELRNHIGDWEYSSQNTYGSFSYEDWENYPNTAKYLRDNGVCEGDNVYILQWW